MSPKPIRFFSCVRPVELFVLDKMEDSKIRLNRLFLLPRQIRFPLVPFLFSIFLLLLSVSLLHGQGGGYFHELAKVALAEGGLS